MNKLRAVTVPTRDHGPVILTCPAWCTTDHTAEPVHYRADLAHSGQHLTATVPFMPGQLPWLVISAEWAPHAEFTGPHPYLAVDLGGYTRRHTPTTLLALVDILATQLDEVRAYAHRLEAEGTDWQTPATRPPG
ncbi:DUF6907 domain-containing protein [Streptomyces sp. KLOTTS4A1]|uniref:DUF6907 domain-containing protein n=1 Tax=Streptomyces sp. KLOTTS4A1 TaxID=3390996 RepID=UPI0039F64343